MSGLNLVGKVNETKKTEQGSDSISATLLKRNSIELKSAVNTVKVESHNSHKLTLERTLSANLIKNFSFNEEKIEKLDEIKQGVEQLYGNGTGSKTDENKTEGKANTEEKKEVKIVIKEEIKIETKLEIIDNSEMKKIFGIKEKINQSKSETGDLKITNENVISCGNPPVKSYSPNGFTIGQTVFNPNEHFLSFEDNNKKYVQKLTYPKPNNFSICNVGPALEVVDGNIKIETEEKEKFKKINTPIFPEEISVNDIKQVGLGNCYMLGPLISMAKFEPNFIKGMMKDNGDDTVTVRLFEKKNGKIEAKYIKIEKSLNESNYQSQGAKWVRIIEKAYATHLGSYQQLGFGDIPGNAFITLYGKDFTLENIKPKKIKNTLNESLSPPMFIEDQKIENLKTNFKNWTLNGSKITLTNEQEKFLDSIKGQTISPHELRSFLSTIYPNYSDITNLVEYHFPQKYPESITTFNKVLTSLSEYPPFCPKIVDNNTISILKSEIEKSTGKKLTNDDSSKLDKFNNNSWNDLSLTLVVKNIANVDYSVAEKLIKEKVIVPHINYKIFNGTDTTQDDFDKMIKFIKDKNSSDKEIITFTENLEKAGQGKFKEIKMIEGKSIDYRDEEKNVFDSIKNSLDSGKLIAIGTRTFDPSTDIGLSGGESKINGLADNHIYAILDCVEMNGRKYIKINNPWNSDYSRTYKSENGILKPQTNNPEDYKYKKPVNIKSNKNKTFLSNEQHNKLKESIIHKTFSKETKITFTESETQKNIKQNIFIKNNKLSGEKIRENESWIELNDLTANFGQIFSIDPKK